MELTYAFEKAARTIEGLTAKDRQLLARICSDIQRSESALNEKAATMLFKCMISCSGICCRNIRLFEIIGFYDFVYLLTVAWGMREDMADRLKHEAPFAGDCIFLENGTGPCLFPANARPRICITSFCFDNTPVQKQIREVNRRFDALARFIFWRRLKSAARWFCH